MGWIRAATAGYPKFIRRFSVRGKGSLHLEITGLGLYRAYLNDERIGKDYLAPGWNDYDAYVRTRSYDVPCREGENILEVFLGEGWYMGRLGMSSGRDRHWGDTLMLWASGTIRDETGIWQFETDDQWTTCTSPVTLCSIYDGEDRDDTLKPGEEKPAVKIEAEYILEKAATPPIAAVMEITPVLIATEDGPVLDFGQNFSGVIRFHNDLPYGSTLVLQTGETLEHGRLYRKNLLTARSAFRYVSDGTEKEIEPMFTFFGFRYALVTSPYPVKAENFRGIVLSCELKETLRCHTGHPGINQLLSNSRWSRLSNFLDVPTDCPQRDERLGWTGDAQVFAETACYQADCKAFYQKYLRDLRIDQVRYYHGDLPMFSPSLRGEAGRGGAVWADAGTIIAWQLYMSYGDKNQLRENYPLMRDYLEVRIEKDRKLGYGHILFEDFTFGDWLALDGLAPKSVFGGTEEKFIQGVYYLYITRLTQQAAEVLGETDDAQKYRDLACSIREHLMGEYITQGGRLSVSTQTGYVLALKHGLYMDHAKMVDLFRKQLVRDHETIRSGFTGAPLLIGTMLEHGLVDEAYRILLSEEAPGWLYEIRQGATTIWERWNAIDEDGSLSDTGMDSLNHYAYGSVCAAIYAQIMGLKGTAPGWKKALIAPKIRGWIRQSEICYESVNGTWRVAWEILDSGEVVLETEVPKDCKAEIVLPDHPQGMRESRGEGKYSYRYMPDFDYLHPFKDNPLILDIMRHPRARLVFASHAPGLYALSLDQDSDVKYRRINELSWGIPVNVRKQVAGLAEKLRTITI